jgi:hypothetical protein
VALGNSTPARACTALVKSPSCAPGVRTSPAATDQPAIDGVEALRAGWLAMQRMPERENIADRVSRRKCHGGGADDAGVDQCYRKPARTFADSACDRSGV